MQDIEHTSLRTRKKRCSPLTQSNVKRPRINAQAQPSVVYPFKRTEATTPACGLNVSIRTTAQSTMRPKSLLQEIGHAPNVITNRELSSVFSQCNICTHFPMYTANWKKRRDRVRAMHSKNMYTSRNVPNGTHLTVMNLYRFLRQQIYRFLRQT